MFHWNIIGSIEPYRSEVRIKVIKVRLPVQNYELEKIYLILRRKHPPPPKKKEWNTPKKASDLNENYIIRFGISENVSVAVLSS